MLKKLKRKFLVASMLSLATVIVILIGTINFLNFKSVTGRADEILDFIMENEGKFPDIKLDLPLPEDFITAETPYESRYFTVIYGPAGHVHAINTSNIAAVDNYEAIKMADSIIRINGDRGFWGNYRYLEHSEYGYKTVIFLDCTKSLDTFKTFLALSFSFSILGMIAVFFFLLTISERILKPISESYNKQRRFIADAGHDIKTPITIIDADAELLELEIGENEWINDIKKQAERLTSLTTDLIYLSKMEETRRDVFRFFPISDVVEDIIQSFNSLAKKRSINLQTDIAVGIFHNGDETGIKKLINILLDNAIKYSPEGTTVEVSLKRQKGGICLRVKNYAEDLTDDAIAHIFERFYRSDSARSSVGGFGIGLSVAQAIVTAHKGKISAQKDGDFLVIEITM